MQCKRVISQAMLTEMEIVRKRVMQNPNLLPQLVKQLRLGDVEQQSKAAEMLFCVVGQGPGRDAAATKQVQITCCMYMLYQSATLPWCKHLLIMQMVMKC